MKAGTLLLLVPLALAPFVAASDGGRTFCTGGDTDPDFLVVADAYGVRTTDGAVWREANGAPGIQTSDRVCHETDADHRVVRSYVDRAADEKVLDGVSPPRPPGVPRCLTPSLCVL